MAGSMGFVAPGMLAARCWDKASWHGAISDVLPQSWDGSLRQCRPDFVLTLRVEVRQNVIGRETLQQFFDSGRVLSNPGRVREISAFVAGLGKVGV